jgi:hypothetical protein
MSDPGSRIDEADVIYDAGKGAKGGSVTSAARSTVIVRRPTFFVNEVGVTATEGLHDALEFVEALQLFECALARHEVAREHDVVETAAGMGTSIMRPDDQTNASLLSSSRREAEGL